MSKGVWSQADFPGLAQMAYLNSAAEGIPPRCVHDALEDYWQDKLAGMKGRENHFARRESCREAVARLVGRKPQEVSFCSCSAEAYNLLRSALALGKDDEVIINDLDFPSGVTPWLSSVPRPTIRLWRSRGGGLVVEDLDALLNSRTRLVQVSLVSFYNGYRLDWDAVREAVRARAERALISVDVTQALGRVTLDCHDADCIISSTHKWILGLHGGCIVAIPDRRAEELTTRAGGWYHLNNAFDADRFDRATTKKGADSFSVGMPNFSAIYALDAAVRYIENTGIERIAMHADPLISQLLHELPQLGLKPMAPVEGRRFSGIIAFQHPSSAALQAKLEEKNIHVMHHAGRLRVSVHGYNSQADIERLLVCLRASLGAA